MLQLLPGILLTPVKSNQNHLNQDGTLFFLPCLRACLGARLLPQSYQYPNLSEGADRVGGQLRGVKECPFSGGTKSGRVWRKVPESDARSVISTHTPAEVTSVFTVMSERRSPVCYTGLYCLALPACCPERIQSVLYTWTLP